MKSIEIFEGSRAQTYDQSIKIWCPDYDFIHALLPSMLHYQIGIPEGKKILIVGSGTGSEIVNLLQFSNLWKITGVDPSPEMVEQAAAKLNSLFPNVKTELVTGTVNDLSPNENWDAAVSILVLQFLPDDGAKLNLLQSIAKRLKKGAPLIFVDIFGEGDSFTRNLSLLKSFLSDKGLDSNVIESGIQHIKQDLFPISSERLNALLSEAGFGEVHMFTQSLLFGGWIATKL